jgi:enoyl-CoA hydratase/carnithine racemase
LNLIDPEIIDELRDLINQIESAKELKVVVFDSADPDFYIAHLDLIWAGELSTDVGPTGLRILPDFMQCQPVSQSSVSPPSVTLAGTGTVM